MFRKLPLIALLPLILASAAPAAPAAVPAAKQQLVYKVQHSKYGNIGTYTNIIEHKGDMTSVATDAKMTVSVMGISLYSQKISRQETWQGNRLVGFHGVTTVNGKSVELDGKAEGDHFTMSTPQGTLTAPADVRLANPWSKETLEGEMMLTPDRGRLEPVTVSTMTPTTLSIGGRQVKTEQYDVLRGNGASSYRVWIDDKGIPVQFSLVSPDNSVTFTLAG